MERHTLSLARPVQVGNVACEALLACLQVLKQRSLAGMAKGAARLLVFLEDHNVIFICNQRSVRQSGRPGADDCDALTLRRLGIAIASFVSGRGIDDAAYARATAHLVDAGVGG